MAVKEPRSNFQRLSDCERSQSLSRSGGILLLTSGWEIFLLSEGDHFSFPLPAMRREQKRAAPILPQWGFYLRFFHRRVSGASSVQPINKPMRV